MGLLRELRRPPAASWPAPWPELSTAPQDSMLSMSLLRGTLELLVDTCGDPLLASTGTP